MWGPARVQHPGDVGSAVFYLVPRELVPRRFEVG